MHLARQTKRVHIPDAKPMLNLEPKARAAAQHNSSMQTPPAHDPDPDLIPPPVDIPVRPPTRRRVLLWLTVIFVVSLIAVGVTVYFERLSIVERVFRGALAERGLDAELEVERLDLNGLVLRDVTLREKGKTVLTADRIVAGYEFREALDGTIKSLRVERGVVSIGLDEEFRIVDGWLQPSGEGGPPVLPYEGVELVDSEVDLDTPFGEFDIEVEGRVEAIETFDLDLRLRPTTFARDDLRVDISGPIHAVRNGDRVDINARLALPSVGYEEMSAADGSLQLKGALAAESRVFEGELDAAFAEGSAFDGEFARLALDLDGEFDAREFRYSGPANVQLASFASERISATAVELASQNLSLSRDGLAGQGTLTASALSGFDAEATEATIDFDVPTPGRLAGQADIAVARVELTPARARSFAESLSLQRVLSASPVARDFSAGLTDEVRRTLLGGALAASLDLDFADARRVTLREPATWQGARNVTVRPTLNEDNETEPTYIFYPDAEQLELRLAASLSGPRGLRVDDMLFEAASPDGLQIAGVERFNARLRTSAWEAQTPDGRTTTLPPLDVRVDSTPARTVLQGGLTFTGDIPGGYVEGLATSGTLTLTPGGRLRVAYRTEAPLNFMRLTTPTGARVEDFTATLLPSDGPVFTGDAEDGALNARLADARFAYAFELEDGTPERFSITAARIDAEGQLRGSVQDWAVNLTEADLRSDTFIGEGTTASAPDVALTARLEQDAPLRFTLDTEALEASTVLASVRAMPVSAAGTLEDFQADFGPGRVRSANPSVPVTTVEGTALFRDGQWVGETTARVRLSETLASEPLDVQFQFRDGSGVADIAFEDLRFDPDGGLQPQDYVPALRGKISRVSGTVDGAFTVRFGVGQPLDGTGYIETANLNLGTAPGPVDGLSTRVEFTSLFPLQTSGEQNLSLRSFDPGLPLTNGDIVYELIPEGIRIVSAAWPFGDGQITLEPFVWEYGAEVNTAVLVVDGVSIQAFLDGFGGGTEALTATGILSGRLPVEIRGVDVEVRNGRVEVPNGGTFSYAAPQTDTAAAQSETTQMAFEALKDFRYNTFALNIDGPLDGEVTIEMNFLGSTPAKLPLPKFVRLDSPIPFEFDVTLTGQIFNILRSLNPANALERAKQELGLIDTRLPEELE